MTSLFWTNGLCKFQNINILKNSSSPPNKQTWQTDNTATSKIIEYYYSNEWEKGDGSKYERLFSFVYRSTRGLLFLAQQKKIIFQVSVYAMTIPTMMSH